MMDMSRNETYINRCLEIASLGLGNTSPNPMVGSVIVHNGQIIGEGFHHKFGSPHAEVNALSSVKDKDLLKESVLFVNLEPCSHTGKTPPCADLIIKYRIPEVVIGTTDPNPLVSGKGILKLQNSGIKVTSGILVNECIELNKRFLTYHKLNRPYIVLKWAQTTDGFIDIIRGDTNIKQPTWISNDISKMIVHKWRSEEQSILVGTQTALLDNPRLNVREWPGNSPYRLVIDRNLRLSKKLNLFDEKSPTIVFNALINHKENNINYVYINFEEDFLDNMLNYLYETGIQSVIVEGGRMLLDTFIESGKWDEARVFKGNKQFGSGVPAPVIHNIKPEEYKIREDLLMLYRNYKLKVLSPQ